MLFFLAKIALLGASFGSSVGAGSYKDLLHGRMNRLLHASGFGLVRNNKCVKIAAAAYLKLAFGLVVLYLHTARIFASANGKKFLKVVDLARHDFFR